MFLLKIHLNIVASFFQQEHKFVVVLLFFFYFFDIFWGSNVRLFVIFVICVIEKLHPHIVLLFLYFLISFCRQVLVWTSVVLLFFSSFLTVSAFGSFIFLGQTYNCCLCPCFRLCLAGLLLFCYFFLVSF